MVGNARRAFSKKLFLACNVSGLGQEPSATCANFNVRYRYSLPKAAILLSASKGSFLTHAGCWWHIPDLFWTASDRRARL